MIKSETESLKTASLLGHCASLFMLIFCCATFCCARENVQVALPVSVVCGIVFAYGFFKQMLFLKQYPKYKISQGRYLFEIYSVLTCAVFSIVLVYISLFAKFSHSFLMACLILKVYYALIVAVAFTKLLWTAHRLARIWYFTKGCEDIVLTYRKNNLQSIRAQFFSGSLVIAAACAGTLLVGLNNAIYFAVCMPLIVLGVCFIVASVIRFVKVQGANELKSASIIVGFCLTVINVVLSHIFTQGSVVVDGDSLKIVFQGFTPILLLSIASSILFVVFLYIAKMKDTEIYINETRMKM